MTTIGTLDRQPERPPGPRRPGAPTAPAGRPGDRPGGTSRSHSGSCGCSTACCSSSRSCSPDASPPRSSRPLASGQPGVGRLAGAARRLGDRRASRAGQPGVRPGAARARRWPSWCRAPCDRPWCARWCGRRRCGSSARGSGGLAGGTASLLAGAPGAVALYGVLALAAWPGSDECRRTPAGRSRRGSRWPGPSIWLDLALVALLPANRSAGAVRDQVEATAGRGARGGSPTWTEWSAPAPGTSGRGPRWCSSWSRPPSDCSDSARSANDASPPGRASCVALAAWVVGQGLGLLTSGSATDPNTGPLLVLCGVALLGVGTRVPAAPTADDPV